MKIIVFAYDVFLLRIYINNLIMKSFLYFAKERVNNVLHFSKEGIVYIYRNIDLIFMNWKYVCYIFFSFKNCKNVYYIVLLLF